MATKRYFNTPSRSRKAELTKAPVSQTGLMALLARNVVKPFDRISDLGVVVVLLQPNSPDADELPPNPGHPACARYVGSEYCRESWQLHLAELRVHPRAHWHRCDFGMYCGMVPVFHRGHCLAAVRLACPTSIPESDFDRHVGLLDILVDNFVAAHTGFLNKLVRVLPSTSAIQSSKPRPVRRTAKQHNHPKIQAAIEYIRHHLRDPSLSIHRVAAKAGLHPNYLSQLFTEWAGQRMCRFILEQRIEMAKRLLATTDLQIKQVAAQSGHAHPHWFSHVFTRHTGMTPGTYRRKARDTDK